MKGKCPYCGAAMAIEAPHFALSKKRMEVFMAIVEAGRAGIAVEDMLKRFFKDRSPMTLRTTIFNINSVIRPWRIETAGMRIRLVKY
tara:strand:- start:614 stop:874 length:261 start_codon:yes stop_codon:yes gene_type:complete